MDGELSTEEVVYVISQLKKDGLHEDWNTYHLIGDAMRQTSALAIDISQNVGNKLADEPAFIAPKPILSHKRSTLRYAIAASVALIISGWFGLQALHQSPSIIVADNSMESVIPVIPVVSSTSSRIPVNPLTSAEINEYLFVHGEFSPGTAMRSSAFYAHPVTDLQER